MLPPIRPRPTNAICIRVPFLEGGGETRERLIRRAVERKPQDAPLGRAQGGEVAERLRHLERGEAEALSGDGQVLVRRGEDHEDRRGRPALVELAGRVQIARAVAHGRRAPRVVAQHVRRRWRDAVVASRGVRYASSAM